MAFGLADLWLISRLKEQGYLSRTAAVIEIGAQQVDEKLRTSNADLEVLGRLYGVPAPVPTLPVGAPGYHVLVGAPPARLIWQWLGVEYAAIDVDGSPGAIPLDLNYDDVPYHLRGKFGLVTNFGTTEHIVNQLNAFKAIHDLAMEGGVMVHNLPCDQPDHGLFGYNQRFFWALGRANDYRIVHMQMGGESIHIALQKQHDMPFVPPLDIDDTTTTDDPALKARYWTLFDRAALDEIAQSRSKHLEETVRKAVAREHAAQAREAAVYVNEQRISSREVVAQDRERAVYVLEQEVDAQRKAVLAREHAVYEREQRTSSREDAAQDREHAVYEREQRTSSREDVAQDREREAYVLEQEVDAQRKAVRARERAVYEREQIVGRRERMLRLVDTLLAVNEFQLRFRRALGRRIPRLVALKHRLFGRPADVIRTGCEPSQTGERGQQDGGDHTTENRP